MKLVIRSLSARKRGKAQKFKELTLEFPLGRTAFIVIMTKLCTIDIDSIAYLSLYFN